MTSKFASKTDEETKKYNTLKDCFQRIRKQEDSVYNARKKSLTEISKLKDGNNYLTGIYSSFSTQLLELENLRKAIIDKLDKVIIPVTAYAPTKINTIKQNINNYQNLQKQKAKQVAAQPLQGSTIDMDNQIKSQEQSIEHILTDFELERITNNKLLFLHLIHAEMAYHAKAFEKLGTLYKDINNVYPCDHMQQFVNDYKITVNNLRDYGYDEREINKRKRKMERDNEEERNSVDDISQTRRNFERGSYLSGEGSRIQNSQRRTNELEEIQVDEI
jgi:hypothetical protein